MLRQLNFKSYFTFLGRNKLYTAINFFGLSVSLAMIVLISTYTMHQLGTDSFQENADRIYAVGCEGQDQSAYYLQKRLLDRYPEIEAATAVSFGNTEAEIGSNRDKYVVKALMADSTFFRIFSFPLVDGDRNAVFVGRYDAVVSESFARRLFGELSPVGQTVVLSGEEQAYTVSGVMRDIDNSVIPYADVVVRAERMTVINTSNNETLDNAGSCVTFLLARGAADLTARADDMLAYFREFYWPYRGGQWERVTLTPLRDLFFSDKPNDMLLRGNRDFVMILFSVAFILLLFAVINYVNLTMAQTGFRAKEMATRRLLGAHKGEVVLKLILESVFFTAVAFLLGLFLADAFNPAACRLLGYEFTIWSEFSPVYAAVCVLFVAVVGVLSGIVPALSIARYKPVDVVKGAFRNRTKMVYSKIFIAVQNAITVAMLVAALTMYLQIRHLVNMPLGYDTEDVMVVDNDIFHDSHDVRAFVEELRRLPQVESAGVGNGTPLWGSNNNTISYGEGRMVSFQQILGDSAYFDIFGLKVKRDNRTGNRNWFFNEYTFRTMGIGEDTAELTLGPTGNYRMTVGGIYEDFRMFHSLRDQSAAMIYRYDAWPYDNSFPWNTVIKTSGDHLRAREAVKRAYQNVVTDGLWNDEGCVYMTDYIARLYAEQDRLLTIVVIFTLLAVLVSALGLLAISTYYILQKRQEIAIRKVFGSTRREILDRLVGSFLVLVAAGSVVAVPFAWWVMNLWLESYSYRMALHWWIFAAAVAAAFVFSTVTVLWQSMRAAGENPVDAVKN